MVRVVLPAVLIAIVLTTGSAQAATCDDFSNQAAAQKAHNTRDPDGDGVYCEDLPCPCSNARVHSRSRGGSHGRLGRSVTLGPWTKRRGCRVRGRLPDRRCTPGAVYSRVTRKRVCTPGYARRVRHVTQSAADAVYAAYGIRHHFTFENGELDHLVSLELGGSNSRANLFPERASPAPGSHQKDRLENRLHSEVCAREISLRRAQRLIARDWGAAYRARFG
jgi:hypothetical protein